VHICDTGTVPIDSARAQGCSYGDLITRVAGLDALRKLSLLGVRTSLPSRACRRDDLDSTSAVVNHAVTKDHIRRVDLTVGTVGETSSKHSMLQLAAGCSSHAEGHTRLLGNSINRAASQHCRDRVGVAPGTVAAALRDDGLLQTTAHSRRMSDHSDVSTHAVPLR
jgi:hypothetical protein